MAMEREQLREWREVMGLSQSRAARVLGVSGETWRSWELGRNPIPAWLDVALEGMAVRLARNGGAAGDIEREGLRAAGESDQG